MAYYQYIGQFYDIEGHLHKVLIYRYGEDDPVFDIPHSAGEQTVVMSHRGGGKDNWDDEVIIGTELEYSFYIETTDYQKIDDLIESGYKTYFLLYTIDDAIYFHGMVKPENITMDYPIDQPHLNVRLTATDGLSDLQNFEFRDVDGSLLKGKQLLLNLIKLALYPLQDLCIVFFIRANTIERDLTNTDNNVFAQLYVSGERFFEENDKGVDVMSCYEVLEAILKPFGCKLMTSGKTYMIINFYENSLGYVYSYWISDLTLIFRTIQSDVVDMTDWLYRYNIERQKLQPVKEVRTVFHNRDIGGNLTDLDLLDPSSWTSTKHAFSSITQIASDPFDADYPVYLQLVSDHSSGANYTGDDITLNDEFEIGSPPQIPYMSYYLKVEIEYKITNLVHPKNYPEMHIEVELLRPNFIDWSNIGFMEFSGNDWIKTDLGTWKTSNFSGETGNFKIRFVFRSVFNTKAHDWTDLTVIIRSIKIVRIAVRELEEYGPEELVLDRNFVEKNNTGFEILDEEVIIGDGTQITEIGTLVDENDTTTEHWTRNGMNEYILLLDTYTRNILLSRSIYKDYLRLSIIDRQNRLMPWHVLLIGSKYFAFSSYTKDYRSGELEAELIQLIPLI